MVNLEGIKIHTMYDDLAAARSRLPARTSASSVKSQLDSPAQPTISRSGKPPAADQKDFPLPPRPNNGRLVLPVKPKLPSRDSAGLISSQPAQRNSPPWFIIGTAFLLILNTIIWGIAIMGPGR